jgi:hypothetical protein
VTEPADVAYTVLDALGIREPVIARRAAEPGTAPLDRLAAALGDRDEVLILDNCVTPSATSSRTMPQTSVRLRGSSPVVGSSRYSTRGLPTRLAARSSLRRIPPERLCASGQPLASPCQPSQQSPSQRSQHQAACPRQAAGTGLASLAGACCRT